MKIYYNYHRETQLGQITVYDNKDEKISVINLDNIKEHKFKELFILNKYSIQTDYFEYEDL